MSFSTNKAQGIIKGGTAGQILIKASNANYETTWGAGGGGGGGAVSSVFGRINAVVATLGDYNSDQVTQGITNLYFTNALTQAALSATSPLSFSSGVISIPQATTSVSGYLSSTDWNTFNSKGSGTVTNIAMTVPAFLAVSGTPITTGSGTFAITSASGLAANSVLATPDSTTGAVSVRSLVANDIPNISAAKITTGVLSPAIGGAPMGFFGDGSDGALNISSGTTTLARDMFYSNLTISGTARLNPNGFRIFVSNTLDITNAPTGAISTTAVAGNNATTSGGTATSTLTAGTLGTSENSAAGATGTTGAGAVGSAVGGGDNSIIGGYSASGGSGGTATGQTASIGGKSTLDFSFFHVDRQLLRGTATIKGGRGGSGGSSGSGDGTNIGGSGGAGGVGGNVLAIFANIISRGSSTAASCISAIGGVGGNGSSPSAGNCGGGGGGSGGGGGCIFIFYGSLSGSTATNCFDLSGGAGGNGANATGTYRGGSGGQGAAAGRIVIFDVKNGTISQSAAISTLGNTATTPTTSTGTSGGTGAVLRVNL